VSEVMSDLLMFKVGARTYAAAVEGVRRIGTVGQKTIGDLVTRSVLGEPIKRQRGIVVSCGDCERTLVVDQVLGVRAVASADLRPMPAFAAACLRSAAVTGFALLDETPTLLIDLPTLIRERHEGDSRLRVEERPDDG
jgi:chemotaxis signal transduction protein